MVALKTEHISKSFEDKQVLKDINITLNENEIVSLLGASGVGKTTLFHVISGLLKPDEGKVQCFDEEITGQAGKISYMLQKDLLLPYKTIEDNVSLPLIIRGARKKDARETVSPYFAEFGLEGTKKKYPHQLSGGMRQRAALLRTYLFSDRIALLDEPFSALDTITKSTMHKWYLDMMQKIKLSTIFITHDIDEAILLSDRIYLLNGSPATITGEVVITQTKPRTEDFVLSNEFLEYKKRIIEML